MKVCLGIDASAPEVSAAVVVDGVLQAEESAGPGPSGELLVSLVRRVLQASGRTLADVDTLAVGIGPGSFTGIRNGIATAQGLATHPFGGAPAEVFGVSSLLAFAGPLPEGSRNLVRFPANGQESYCAFIGVSPDGALELLSGALVLPSDGIANEARSLGPGYLAPDGDARPLSLVSVGADGPRPTLAARTAALTFRTLRPLSTCDESLFQCAPGGRGLQAVYAKPVHAKTLVERGFPLTRVK